jgi:O-antigen/teichoic acid export membrane protein
MPDSEPQAPRGVLARLVGNPLLRRVIRNSGYLFTGSTAAAAMSFAQGVLAARLVGVIGFGLLGTITQFSSVINRLTSFRMGDLVVSYVGEFSANHQDQHAAAVFKAAGSVEILSSLLAYGLVVVLAPLGARLFAHDPTTSGLFALYGLMVLANLMSESATGLLQIFDCFKLIGAITAGQSLITLLAIGAAFLMKGGLTAVVVAYLVGKSLSALAFTLAALVLARQTWGAGWWRVPLGILSNRRRELVRFAVSTNLTSTLTLITRDSEILWLGAFTSSLQVGYYKVALAFVNVLLIPVNPLISTTYREVAREVATKSWDNVRYLLRTGSLLAAGWTVPAGAGLVILGPWLISIYGHGFLPAYPTLLILLLGVTVVNIFYWNRSVLLPLGLPEYPTKVSLAGALLKILVILGLVPILGANGMAISLTGFFIFTAGVLIWKTQQELKRAAVRTVPQEI